MRIARCIAAAACVVVAASVVSGAGFGVNAHIPSDPVADRIRDAGIAWARIDFLWSLAEPERDVYDWAVYDELVDRLEARGVKIFSGLGATPAWATDGSEFNGVPDDADQWREFCYLAARRYAGRIHAWGLWNEPNLERFWLGTRSEFIDTILLPGAEAIRLADPSALVCGPDLAHLSSANWEDWLVETVRAAIDLLDVVTHHVYPSGGLAIEVTNDLEEGGQLPFQPPSVREVLQDAEWWGRPFWLTETGVESERWGEGRQASFVENLLGQWFSPTRGNRDWVDAIFFYEINDGPSPSPYSFGLLTGPPELAPKEAYLRYQRFITDAVVDDAEVVASEVPAFFRPGETRRCRVVLRNTGTTTWEVSEMTRLDATVSDPGWSIEVGQLAPAESVSPGATRTFEIDITAPGGEIKEIGVNPRLEVRMEREGSWSFGEMLRREFVVSAIDPPRITGQPEPATVARGARATLAVTAGGADPLSYRWLRNGAVLADGPLYSGSTTPELVVTAASHEAAAFYQCVVSNRVGDVVSEAAAVTIGQPAPRRGGRRVAPIPTTPPGPVPPLRLTGPAEPR